MVKDKTKINVNKMFTDEEVDFLPSLNDEIRNGLTASKMKVKSWDEVNTQFGTALRIELTDMETNIEYSFLNSGKVFRKLFEGNVDKNDLIKIYLNEKNHWRFEFVK